MLAQQKQFIMLSGLPRTGSTLLSSILSENPQIHSEGNSGLCQLMWDLQFSCTHNAVEQLTATKRLQRTTHELVSALPALYYSHVDRPVVLDKCRSWTLPANVKMLQDYFATTPKTIVMVRKIEEIVKSFAQLRIKNGVQGDVVSDLLVPNKEPIMRSLSGAIYARKHNPENCLFVDYEELTKDTVGVLKRIYSFCNLDYFAHDLTNIKNRNPEADEHYGLLGFHDIRPTVSVVDNHIELPDEVTHYCRMLDKLLAAE
jgi:sulfotransferase